MWNDRHDAKRITTMTDDQVWRLKGACIDDMDAYDSQQLPRHGRKRAEKAWRLCADCPVLRDCAEQTARDIESGRIPVGVVVAGAAYHDNASNGRRTDAYRTLEFLIGRPLSNPAA